MSRAPLSGRERRLNARAERQTPGAGGLSGTPNVTLVAAYSLLYALPVLVLYSIVNWRYGFRFFGGIKR